MKNGAVRLDISKITTEQKRTRQRIIEISYKFHLSHLGSCLSAVDLIDSVYKVKKNDEKFVLSNGHAGIALYAILEKYGFIKDPNWFKSLNVHPDRNLKLGIYVSTGSLGQGLPIALGMAFANRKQNVYCMISDGECAEGSIWEALRIAVDHKLDNLKIIINANGWGAYGNIDINGLKKKIQAFGYEVLKIDGHNIDKIASSLTTQTDKKPLLIMALTTVEQLPFLKEQDAHYYTMTEKDFVQALDILIW